MASLEGKLVSEQRTALLRYVELSNVVTAAKKKREEEQKKRDKIRNGISQYFNAKTTTAAPKAKVRIWTRYGDSKGVLT
jgi:hypothetical protein